MDGSGPQMGGGMLRLEGRADASSGQIRCRATRWAVAVWAAAVVWLALSGLAPRNVAGATGNEQPYRVKVAFLFNFASLVKWPEESFHGPDAPFVICHYGGSQTRGLFETAYSGRMVERHPIEVWDLSSVDDVLGCHIMMITAERSEEVDDFLSAVAGKSVLTIGETDGFARSGGVIGFYSDGSKIRFEVNLGAAKSARLRISSRLLKLARLVSSEGE